MHLERLVADESVEKESASIPDFNMHVLFHQLEVACLVLHLDL